MPAVIDNQICSSTKLWPHNISGREHKLEVICVLLIFQCRVDAPLYDFGSLVFRHSALYHELLSIRLEACHSMFQKQTTKTFLERKKKKIIASARCIALHLHKVKSLGNRTTHVLLFDFWAMHQRESLVKGG